MGKQEDEAKEYVLKRTKDQKIKFIRLWFTDILGFLKSFSITAEQLEEALTDGMGFDGSSIQGFARIDESDMIAMPDPNTYQVIPWRPKEQGVVRMFCDIHWPGGQPFDGDPRFILKKNLKRAADMGFTFYVGPELEYFYFKNSETTEFLDLGGYFDLTPPETASDIRRETILFLEEMGIDVEYSHHEVAPSQHEIDLRYCDALTMADNVMTYRIIVKQVAQQQGCYATFMPKPVFGCNGSGMHVHMSLFKGNRNAFFDKDAPFHLSETGRYFTAGLLKHVSEITSICNQWVNSYKRIVPGYEAPCYITWARRNRADLIRIPEYKPGRETATRVELRSPDPACNPYLAFSVMLAAGLEGIEKEYKLEPPTEENVFELSAEQREKKKIKTLPGSLYEALQLTEKSAVVRKALGDHAFESFIQNKIVEWDRYRTYVTDYELKNYLPIL